MALLRSFVLVVLAFSLLAAACSDEAATGVVFGEGEIPETLPDGFPIPDDARIDSTLVDYDRGVTEMLCVIPAEVPAVVAYYETNLPTAGYTVDSSDGNLAEWSIAFSDADGDGTLVLRVGAVDVTQAVVRFSES